PWQWVSNATGINVSVFDLAAAGIAAGVGNLLALFFYPPRIGGAPRAAAPPPQTAPPAGTPPHQRRGEGSGGAGLAAPRGGIAVGCAQRRSVRAHLSRAQGAAGAYPRRLRIDSGRDRRRPDRWRKREARRGLHRPARRRRHRGVVPVRASACFLASATGRLV